MKKILLAIMVFSLIFASNSVSLAEETDLGEVNEKPIPVLYSTTSSSDENAPEVKPMPKEWLRGASSTTANADIEANKKLEERKGEENKNKLEAEKKLMEQKLEMAKKDLEKISSPTELKFYEKIQKIGTALWGVKKSEVKSNSSKLMEKREDGSKPALEKISSPTELKFFEKIQKIGTALWGIRKLENKIEVRQSFVKPVAVQCTKDAINKKDTALQASLSNRMQSIVSAIKTRNACQNSALDKLTAKEQFDANKVCVEAYQKSGNEYNNILEKSKNESWNVYKTDLKACSVLQKNSTSSDVTSTSKELSEEIMISDGEEDNLIK